MGVTVMVALMVWVSGAFLEFKIIDAIPQLKALFHGLPGILISVGIGALVAFILGAPAGAGVMLGQLMGLATNDFTFRFFTNMRVLNNKAKEQKAKVTEFKSAHPKIYSETVEGAKAGLKVTGGLILGTLYVIALPFRGIGWVMKKYEQSHTT